MQVNLCLAQSPGYTQIPSGGPPAPTFVRPDSTYRFSNFEYGKVTFATNFSPDGQLRLNYNLFTGQMDVINSKGDTLEMQPMRELKLITVADHVFLHSYKTGYLEILYQSTVSLGVRNLLAYAPVTIAGNSYIRSAKGETSKQNFTSLATYYFIDRDTKSYKASPSSIRKLFDDHQKAIKQYLNENNVDFNKEADLIKLLTFCNQLNTETKR